MTENIFKVGDIVKSTHKTHNGEKARILEKLRYEDNGSESGGYNVWKIKFINDGDIMDYADMFLELVAHSGCGCEICQSYVGANK